MGTHSLNISDDHKLINFNVPKYLITNFDSLVRFKRVSRTSMLVRLMEDYIRSERRLMEEDNSLNQMIRDIEVRNKNSMKKEMIGLRREVEEELEPPMVPYSSDNRSWDDYTNDQSNDDWSDINGTDFLNRLGR